jgi:hypothetical protein
VQAQDSLENCPLFQARSRAPTLQQVSKVCAVPAEIQILFLLRQTAENAGHLCLCNIVVTRLAVGEEAALPAKCKARIGGKKGALRKSRSRQTTFKCDSRREFSSERNG